MDGKPSTVNELELTPGEMFSTSVDASGDKSSSGGGVDSESSRSLSDNSLSSMQAQDERELFVSSTHAGSSLDRMYAYYQAQQLTDVVLKAGDTVIKAHRIVLSSASDYFNAMFTSGLRESSQAEIELYSVTGDALKDLVKYCYIGSIELRDDSVENILSAASLLQLNKVVEACSLYLERQLNPSNSINITLFADSLSCHRLRDAASAYTAEHFVEVLKNQEYLMLPSEEVAKLLQSDELNVPSEEVIFKGLMTWVQHDAENRRSELPKLLEYVKLPLLSPTFLTDVVEPAVGSEGQRFVMEALKYHVLPERRTKLHSFRTNPRKSTAGYLLAVGGKDANTGGATSIEVYDPRHDCWKFVGKMDRRRLQFGVAAVGKKLIVGGGRDGLKTLNTVECFDLETRNWHIMGQMTNQRHGLGLALISDDGPLYAVGGHDGWSYLNTVERLDPDTGTWSYVAPMNTPRSTVGLAVLNNKLYAVGGRDGLSCLKTVEVYDPRVNKWTNCAPMSKRRGGVAVAVLNGCLYALGGHDVPTTINSAARFGCVERYDPNTDSWTSVAPMSVGRDAIGAGVLGNRLIAVGGYDGHSYLPIVEAYNPYTNSWSQVASLSTGRAGTCVVFVKNFSFS